MWHPGTSQPRDPGRSHDTPPVRGRRRDTLRTIEAAT
jgi:hypothetical protein